MNLSAQLAAVLVAQPFRLRVPASSRCQDTSQKPGSRGESPLEPAGGDACATILPGDGENR